MAYKSTDEGLIIQAVKKLNCGQRFHELALKHRKSSPTYWMKLLGLKSRNQVYLRWKTATIRADELLIICDDLGVTLSEFYGLPSNKLAEPAQKYEKRRYIEDDLAEVMKRLNTVEKRLQECEERYPANPSGAKVSK
jgi:hypothetical protein